MRDAYDLLFLFYGHACNCIRLEISRLELMLALPRNGQDAEEDPVYVQGKIEAFQDVVRGLEAAIEKAKERRDKK